MSDPNIVIVVSISSHKIGSESASESLSEVINSYLEDNIIDFVWVGYLGSKVHCLFYVVADFFPDFSARLQ